MSPEADDETMPSEIASLRQRIAELEQENARRLQNEATLREARDLFQRVLDYSPTLVFVKDCAGHILLINHQTSSSLHLPIPQMIGKKDSDLFPPEIVDTWRANDQQVISLGKPLETEELIPHQDGLHTYLTIKFPLYNEHGEIYAVGGIATDITERKRVEQALREANHQLQLWVAELKRQNREITLLNHMSDFLQSCLTVQEAYQVVAQCAAQLFEGQAGGLYILSPSRNVVEAVATWGEPPPEDLIFAPDACWALRRWRTHLVKDNDTAPLCRHLDGSNPLPYVCVPLIAQGETLGILHLRHGPVASNQARERWEWLVLIVADHLALALANLHLRERLRTQSTRDPLTGLFNRRYLNEVLEREFRRAARYHRPVGMMMLDIDHFKELNDSYGHDAGDVLLHMIGTFLETSTRGEDIACRYGGEEFVIVLPEAALLDTHKRAEELRVGIKKLRAQHQGQWLRTVTVSVGVASFPEHGTSAAEVIKAADDMLYRAKAQGRDRVVVHPLPGDADYARVLR